MGMFSIDENPAFLEQDLKIKKIKNIIKSNLNDAEKIFYIKLILDRKYEDYFKEMVNNA